MSKREKIYNFIYWLVPISLVTGFVDFYLGTTKITFVLKTLGLIATILVLRNAIRRCDGSFRIKKMAIAFLSYYVFSSTFYLFNGRPISCLLNEYYNFIPAYCFFFIGMSDPDRDNKFYQYFLLACTISMVVGLSLYVAAPGWYLARNIEIVSNHWSNTTSYGEDSLLSQMRFSSYFGDPYGVDIYAIIALSISLFFFYYGRNKTKDWYFILCIIVNFVAAVMSQQRVAMAVAAIILSAYLVYGVIKGYGHHTTKLLFVFFSLLFLVLLYVFSHFADRIDTIQLLLSGRLEAMSFSEAVNERNYQMDLLRHYWNNPILGMGAGSGEAGARAAGLPGVTDCSYIALLFDVGIIGGFLFLAIMLKSIFRGLHFLKYYLVELGIMFFVLVAMIGSNTIHMGFMFVLPFWYAVGRIWNKDYLKYAIENKIYV